MTGPNGDIVAGIWARANGKSFVFYPKKAFDEAGYTVPTTWEELDALVEKMVADGNVPWSMGMESGDATGWTGTDFIQDILLVTQGPEYVSKIITGEIPYNDAGVREAYEIYGKWAMDPKYTVGGAEGTLSTGFNDAILKVFSDVPEAFMVKQSGFASGTILGTYPDKVYGVDYDFFGVPGAKGLQGGSDWLMVFNDTPAVRSLIKYLSSDKGGQMWAEVGFDLTPNAAGNASYASAESIKKAELLSSTTGFTPDIGDSIPGGFGSVEFGGITDFVNGGDLTTILDTIAAAQADALAQ
jgi:alpha-glucoside transport system substrate-binding protein